MIIDTARRVVRQLGLAAANGMEQRGWDGAPAACGAGLWLSPFGRRQAPHPDLRQLCRLEGLLRSPVARFLPGVELRPGLPDAVEELR